MFDGIQKFCEYLLDLELQYTGPLKKLFHYAIFQKFFFHILLNIMVYDLQCVLLNVHAILFL